VWALSRRYGLRPTMPEYNLNRLSKMFERSALNIPSLRTLGLRCELLPWLLDEHRYGSNILSRPKDIFRKIQVPLKNDVTLLNGGVYTIDAYFTVPVWNELANDLVIRSELRAEANQRLRHIRNIYYYTLKVQKKILSDLSMPLQNVNQKSKAHQIIMMNLLAFKLFSVSSIMKQISI
jgi:hypothetical protein